MPVQDTVVSGRTPRQARRRKRAVKRAVPPRYVPAPSFHPDATRQARPRRPTPFPHGDVKTPRDLNRGDRYKRTPAYHRALAEAGRAGEQYRRELARSRPRHRSLIGGGLAFLTGADATGTAAVIGGLAKKELEGRGVLAAGSHAIGGGLASLAFGKGSPISLIGGAPQKVAQNALKDLIDLPAQAVPSVYVPASALAHGKVGKAARLFGDPVVDVAKHPVRSFVEHPLNTALIVRGGLSVGGRAAGAAARRAPSAAAREYASTKRAPELVYGGLERQRRYSADLLEKRLQVARERARARANAKHGFAPSQMTGRRLVGEVQRRVDETVDVNEVLRRSDREHAVHDRVMASTHRVAGKRVHIHGHDAVPLIVERALRSPKTVKEDLVAERARLTREAVADAEAGRPLTGDKRRAHEQTVAHIDKLLKDKAFLADPVPAFRAADAYVADHAPLEQALVEGGHLDAGKLASKYVPYAVRHMGAKVTGHGLTVEGERLSTADIQAHMRAHGVPEPGFFTQRPGFKGSYYISTSARPFSSNASRSGEAVRLGLHDISPQVLTDQHVTTAGLLSSIQGVNRIINEFGLKKSKGEYFKDNKEAQAAVRDIAAQAARDGRPVPELVPMRVASFTTRGKLLDTIKDSLSPDHAGDFARQFNTKLESAFDEGDGPVVLVPKIVKDRVLQHTHQAASGPGERAMQVFTSQFRQTVLPTSIKWLMGNLSELLLRTGLTGSGPRNVALGHRILDAMDRLDPEMAKEFGGRAIGGAHFASAKRFDVYRDARAFEGSRLEAFANAMHKAGETPGPKQVVSMWKTYRDAVLAGNRHMEDLPQFAALGREARKDIRELTGRWESALKVSDDAVKDLAAGHLDRNSFVRYAREIDTVVGKYSKLSPGTRKLISGYAPFALWYLNAIKFVYATLPRDHPAATALVAAAYNSTEELRKDAGLGLFLPKNKRRPDFLQGSTPDELPLQRYLPFGALNQGPGATARDLLLPQVSGALLNLAGKDWKLDDLKLSPGKNDDPVVRSMVALNTLAESTIPLVGYARRLREGAGTSYAESTALSPKIKKGTRRGTGAAANKIFNPLARTPRTKVSKAKAGSGRPDWSKAQPVGGGAGQPDWSRAVPVSP